MEIQDDDLERLKQQLQAEESHAVEARLNSFESFTAWVKANPALQQLGLVDAINQYGPAILEIVRGLIGA